MPPEEMADATEQRAERVQLLVTGNPEQADAWAHALEEAGVDVLVEITDSQIAEPGSSPLIGVLGARPMEFVHVLTVHPADRERAMRALVDAGWNGREGLRVRRAPDLRQMTLAALSAVLGIAAFIVIRTVLS